MKNVVFIASIILSFCLFSCGNTNESDSSPKTPKDRLNGSWEIVEAEGTMAEINVGTRYTFEGTKRFSTKKGIIENKGDITDISDNHYKVIFDGMQTEYTFNYRFEGDKLIIEAGTEGQVFTLEKK